MRVPSQVRRYVPKPIRSGWRKIHPLSPSQPRPTFGSALTRAFEEVSFSIVDIGSGIRRSDAINNLGILAPFSHYVACDPDNESAESDLEPQVGPRWRKQTFFHEAVSNSEKHQQLYITRADGMSSLLRPNPTVVNKFYFADAFDVESTVTVPVIGLDSAASTYGFKDVCFLKLDTQGTELDILRSGSEILDNAVLGVFVEVEFHQFYENQPLFSDVDQFLRSRGFELFDLHRSLHRRASYQSDYYSRKQVTWAHALYLKDLEPLSTTEKIDSTLVKTTRMLGLALAFEHFDLARELAATGPFASIFQDRFGVELSEDVNQYVVYRTQKILARPPRVLAGADLMQTREKDRHHIYR